jgi:dipeptidase E
MRLFFHSDQISFNNVVDKKIFSILDPQDIKLGYIPSSSDLTRKHFIKQEQWYRQYGVKDFFYFDLGVEYDESKITELLSCDLIHLAGGPTNIFADNIKKRNFKSVLEEFLKKDGILVGISAGSYIMTPNFEIRRVYDNGYDGSSDYKGMGLVDFEFLPHYQTKIEYLDAFKEYSRTNNGREIYLCEDDNGIFFNKGEIEILGKVLILKDGEVGSA